MYEKNLQQSEIWCIVVTIIHGWGSGLKTGISKDKGALRQVRVHIIEETEITVKELDYGKISGNCGVTGKGENN